MSKVSDGHTNKTIELIRQHRFSARAKALFEIRSVVRDSLQQSQWQEPTIEDIVLAIDEACQNIIRHAYGGETDEEIVLDMIRDDKELMILLQDFAPKVDPDCMKLRNLDDIRPGGLGCHFIQKIMDEVSIGPSPTGQGNVLRMVKRLR